MSRIISLDLGEKSIGICISDKTNTIPIPLENYFFERKNYEQAFKILKNILKKFNDVNLILLGYPLRLNGEKSTFALEVKKFYNMLKNNLDKNIKIKLYDERFTTKIALNELLKNYENPKKLKDVASAYIILYDYLSNKEKEEG
ncbi:MAG: putative pre-16S rRNA nuclease [Candidatus Hepatoplasma vulgare]|nr:MAG: putative pre-16S rRNA nuclease [Candidatus Hepatoplasma sp.]